MEMNNVEKVERASGPITALGFIAYLVLQFNGALPTPGIGRIERDIDRVVERVGKVDERMVMAERNIDRVSFSIENNREFITNTAGALRDMNKALAEMQLAVVRIEGKLNEIDRRTGGVGGGRGPQ